MKTCLIVVAMLGTLLTSGCVTGRRSVALVVPPSAAAPETVGTVHLGSITDARTFMNRPPDPWIPSVEGDVAAMSADQKATMIGRQRNTYGRALGDVALPAGSSVAQVTRTLIEQGLKQRGFSTTADAGAPISIDVSIDEFWGWFTPGMWVVSFEARVYCTLTIKSSDQSTQAVIKGYGINRGQVASDANWQLAYRRAFEDFLLKIGPELSKAGL